MKQEDFERLKVACETEGFGINAYCEEGTYFIWKKDPWYGVDFVERLEDGFDESKGAILKVHSIKKGHIQVYNGWISKCSLKPSIESAYVEQLKKQALSSVIAEGKYTLTASGIYGGSIETKEDWVYRKDTDTLYFHGIPIYQNGIWAKKEDNKKQELIKALKQFKRSNKEIIGILKEAINNSKNK